MLTRNYSMADADLKQLADALTASINRDITDFNSRNVDSRKVDALQVLIDSFDSTTTDQELLGLVTTATEIRDGISENIRKAVRPIRNMAEMAYSGKGKYSTFGFEDLSRISDNDLYRLARRVVRVANLLMADLSQQGLTAAQVTDLDALATQLDTAIDAIGQAIETRDIETQDRIIKGNALWAEMGRLASIGKSLYEDTNEAKFNDYVLVGSSAAPVTPVPEG